MALAMQNQQGFSQYQGSCDSTQLTEPIRKVITESEIWMEMEGKIYITVLWRPMV